MRARKFNMSSYQIIRNTSVILGIFFASAIAAQDATSDLAYQISDKGEANRGIFFKLQNAQYKNCAYVYPDDNERLKLGDEGSCATQESDLGGNTWFYLHQRGDGFYDLRSARNNAGYDGTCDSDHDTKGTDTITCPGNHKNMDSGIEIHVNPNNGSQIMIVTHYDGFPNKCFSQAFANGNTGITGYDTGIPDMHTVPCDNSLANQKWNLMFEPLSITKLAYEKPVYSSPSNIPPSSGQDSLIKTNFGPDPIAYTTGTNTTYQVETSFSQDSTTAVGASLSMTADFDGLFVSGSATAEGSYDYSETLSVGGYDNTSTETYDETERSVPPCSVFEYSVTASIRNSEQDYTVTGEGSKGTTVTYSGVLQAQDEFVTTEYWQPSVDPTYQAGIDTCMATYFPDEPNKFAVLLAYRTITNHTKGKQPTVQNSTKEIKMPAR